jgi:hypothetical protein
MKTERSKKLQKSFDFRPQNSLLHKCVEEREKKRVVVVVRCARFA